MRHVALLRGINVGGHKRVPMAELRDALGSSGFDDVATYLQSGNVVVDTGTGSGDALAERMGDVIAERFGFDVAVVVRSAAELSAVAAANPFPEAAATDPKKVHVVFLSSQPAPGVWEGLDPADVAPEEWRVGDRVVYLHLPNGLGRSPLADAVTRRVADLTATTRNWNTVARLVEMVGEGAGRGRPPSSA